MEISMYNEHNSVSSWHKIIRYGLTLKLKSINFFQNVVFLLILLVLTAEDYIVKEKRKNVAP